MLQVHFSPYVNLWQLQRVPACIHRIDWNFLVEASELFQKKILVSVSGKTGYHCRRLNLAYRLYRRFQRIIGIYDRELGIYTAGSVV